MNELTKRANAAGVILPAGAAVAAAGVMSGASATTVTVDIGTLHTQEWDVSEGVQAVGYAGIAIIGLFVVIKVVKSVMATVV